MHNLRAHYRELDERLRGLRNLLSDAGYLKYFDESLQANEFGEALHALCDFMLESGTPPVNDAALDQIKGLHALMNLEDDCVERLRQKVGH